MSGGDSRLWSWSVCAGVSWGWGLCATDLNAASQRAEHDGADGETDGGVLSWRLGWDPCRVNEAAVRADVVKMASRSAPHPAAAWRDSDTSLYSSTNIKKAGGLKMLTWKFFKHDLECLFPFQLQLRHTFGTVSTVLRYFEVFFSIYLTLFRSYFNFNTI